MIAEPEPIPRKLNSSILQDESRRLPPDSKGRKRYIDYQGYVWVCVGTHHPVCHRPNQTYVRETHLKLWEAGIDYAGKMVAYRDGNRLNTDVSNLVLCDTQKQIRGLYPSRFPRKKKVFCKCGCGTEVRGRRWAPGHWKSKHAAFKHLPVSRERHRQLWRYSQGICRKSGCTKAPASKSGLCMEHYQEYRVKARDARMRRMGRVVRGGSCWSRWYARKAAGAEPKTPIDRIEWAMRDRGWTWGKLYAEFKTSNLIMKKVRETGVVPRWLAELLSLEFDKPESYWEHGTVMDYEI